MTPRRVHAQVAELLDRTVATSDAVINDDSRSGRNLEMCSRATELPRLDSNQPSLQFSHSR